MGGGGRRGCLRTQPGAIKKSFAQGDFKNTGNPLDLVIKGQAGETYRPSVSRDGKRVRTSAPSFTVLGRSGKVHGSGKFQFG